MCDKINRSNHRHAVYNKDKSFRTLIFHRSQDQPILMLKRDELVKTLQMHNVFETDDDRNKRKLVLHKLNMLARAWVKNLVAMKNLPADDAERVNVKVLTFGSYKLGVHDSSVDIDTLFVGTKHVTRTDFFMSFYQLLSCERDIEELRSIEDAYVPLIKMKVLGIEIDILFVRLWIDEMPEHLDLRDSSWLSNLNEICVRSLNGYRVTIQLLHLVPNVQKFRLALRAIRLWAKCKGIYGNMLGFLGGVSWAILVAKICITYPNVDVVGIVEKFFEVYSKWKWPEPVVLQELENSDLGYPIWDSQSRDLMPIITPIYPECNSSFNVLRSTLQVIRDELESAHNVIRNINMGIANWGNLFEKSYFFGHYNHYLVLFVSSQTHRNHIIWRGFVEAKMRYLTALLENHPNVVRVHINTESFKPVQHPSAYCYMRFFGLRFKAGETIDDGIMQRLHLFLQTVKIQAEWLYKLTDDMDLEATIIKRKDLQNYIPSVTFKRDQLMSSGLHRCQMLLEMMTGLVRVNATCNSENNDQIESC